MWGNAFFKTATARGQRYKGAWLILLVLMLASMTWAGIRINPLGGKIVRDIVAPGGGGRIINGQGYVINGSVGQCAVGLSVTSSGNKLFHGVHGPVWRSVVDNNAAVHWDQY